MKSLRKIIAVSAIVLMALITVVMFSAAALNPVTGAIERFNVTATAAGANEIIAGQANNRFLIMTLTVSSCSDTTDSFYMSSGSTELWYTAAVPKSIDQAGVSGISGVSLFPYAGGHFLTEVGEDFTINLTSGENVNVMGTYMVVR